jgi:hypothetical protein
MRPALAILPGILLAGAIAAAALITHHHSRQSEPVLPVI